MVCLGLSQRHGLRTKLKTTVSRIYTVSKINSQSVLSLRGIILKNNDKIYGLLLQHMPRSMNLLTLPRIPARISEIWTIKCGEMWALQPKHELGTGIENLREHSQNVFTLFGVNMHPYFQIRFFFVCSRGAPVLAKDINLQMHSILSTNLLYLRFSMTLTTRNVSFWTMFFIYNPL